jgi:hypothetical protein
MAALMQLDNTVGQINAVLKKDELKCILLIVTSGNGSPERNGSLEAPGAVVEMFGYNPRRS